MAVQGPISNTIPGWSFTRFGTPPQTQTQPQTQPQADTETERPLAPAPLTSLGSFGGDFTLGGTTGPGAGMAGSTAWRSSQHGVAVADASSVGGAHTVRDGNVVDSVVIPGQWQQESESAQQLQRQPLAWMDDSRRVRDLFQAATEAASGASIATITGNASHTQTGNASHLHVTGQQHIYCTYVRTRKQAHTHAYAHTNTQNLCANIRIHTRAHTNTCTHILMLVLENYQRLWIRTQIMN